MCTIIICYYQSFQFYLLYKLLKMEIPILNQIKFLGIRPLKEGESNPNALKIFRNLHPGEMYYFYDGCDISEERIELK